MRHAGDACRRPSRDDRERTGRRRAGSSARGVRRDGWVAMRLLHAGDRRACGLAARSQEWRGDAGRDRPRARRAPVPVHRLAHRQGGDRRRGAAAMCPAPHEISPPPGFARRWRAVWSNASRWMSRAVTVGSPTTSRHATRSSRSPLSAAGSADEASFEAAGLRWALGSTLVEARSRAGKIQGRRTTQTSGPPLALPELPPGGVRLATSWVEPAYLEPDASWCVPGGDAASPLANGGAFGGKVDSVAAGCGARARRSARSAGARRARTRGRRAHRPQASTDRGECGARRHDACASSARSSATCVPEANGLTPYAIDVEETWTCAPSSGPRTSPQLRAWPLAERTVLVEGALAEAGADRAALARRRSGAQRAARRVRVRTHRRCARRCRCRDRRGHRACRPGHGAGRRR